MILIRAFILSGILSHASFLTAKTRAEITQSKVAENPEANWWDLMDTGPFISDTFLAFGPKGEVAALKGLAIKVGPEEDHTVVFDTETLRMVAGFKGTVMLEGTPWSGKHADNSYFPESREDYFFATKKGPGVAVKGNCKDPRENKNGPLPDQQGEYLGLYRHKDGTVLSYTVGGTRFLEMPWKAGSVLVRSFVHEPVDQDLEILLHDRIEGVGEIDLSLRNVNSQVVLKNDPSGRVTALIPKGLSGSFDVAFQKGKGTNAKFRSPDLGERTRGGPSLFPETITTKGRVSKAGSGYAVDDLPLPKENPWQSKIRFGAFDFFSDGNRVACSTWNGDVWIGEGIKSDLSEITWRRFASGLFQTLGLKIVDDVIYTHGRDQITRLHDLNKDGEADFYECFNNDVLITKGFHEFAFDLQTDAEGNFYFSKGAPVLSGGRGFSELTEHNGTILKVSSDGKTLTRMASGLRAPGGLGVGPNGELTTGENEGSYVPRCKITWSKPDGTSFHGVVPSVWDNKKFVRALPGTPTDYQRPLCWLPYYVDNSSGSQFWVPKGSSWENHAGHMLHLSYGKSSIYRALIDEVDGQVQGGVYRLPIELTTANMRGRFHPETGHLYVIGFRGWQTNGGTGFQRIRFLSDEKPVPLKLKAFENGLKVEFSASLDPAIANDPRRYAISKWDYVWGPQYGSGRFSIDEPDPEERQKALVEPSKGSVNQVDAVEVRAARLLEDGKSVFLYVPKMTPAMQMEIRMDLADAAKNEFQETIWNTIHNLRPAFRNHGLDLANLPMVKKEARGEPGLLMSSSKGSADDAVVVDRLALTIEEKGVVSVFIKDKQAVFEGSLVIEARDQRAFRLEGSGWASLKLNGKQIMEGELPLECPPLSLEAGPQALFCHFKGTSKGTSRLRLLWSGSNFVWEPVKPSAYRYTANSMLGKKDKARSGRNLFAAAHCIKCHEPDKNHFKSGRMPELFETLPDLRNAGHRYHRGWLEQWIRQPEDHCPSVAPDDAADIAAYLSSRKMKTSIGKDGDADKGSLLIKELHLEPWAEELAKTGKLTAIGLRILLLNPAQHHSHTTFPSLRLSQQEAADISSAILARATKAPVLSGGDMAKGKTLFAQRCATCHEPRKGVRYEFPAKGLKEMWNTEWFEKGCLSEEEGNAPELGLSLEQKQDLFAFKNIDGNRNYTSLRRFVPHEYAARALERFQCASCHSGKNKLPEISLAGEKFHSGWLQSLLDGEALKARPWLQARMPGFSGHSEVLATGLAYRAGRNLSKPELEPEPRLVEVGKKITGAVGYACTTCHAMGEMPALQAFEGQGPNLEIAANRLRPDYYRTWMFWPQRHAPLTIMPKYTIDKERALNSSFYEGNADKQFQAILHYLHTLEGAEKAPLPEKE